MAILHQASIVFLEIMQLANFFKSRVCFLQQVNIALQAQSISQFISMMNQ